MPRAKPTHVPAANFQPRTRELATFKTLSCYPAEWDALVRYSDANEYKTPMDVIRKMAHAWLPAAVSRSFRQPNFSRRETPGDSRGQSPARRTRRPQPA